MYLTYYPPLFSTMKLTKCHRKSKRKILTVSAYYSEQKATQSHDNQHKVMTINTQEPLSLLTTPTKMTTTHPGSAPAGLTNSNVTAGGYSSVVHNRTVSQSSQDI